MSFGTFKIDEGTDPQTGVRTIYHFENDQVVVQKQYDAEPYLKRAAEMREANAGKPWGEGMAVGVLPPWELHKINAMGDPKEREKAMRLFFRENPAFLAVDAFLQ